MSPPESFYYLDDESKKTVGPFTWDVLERMRGAGLITDDTLLLGETQTDWKSFGVLKTEIPNPEIVLPVPTRPETPRAAENTQLPSAELERDSETEVRDIPTAATPNVDENEKTPTNSLVWRFIVIGLIIVSALAIGLMGNSSLRQGQDLTPAGTLPPHDFNSDTTPVSHVDTQRSDRTRKTPERQKVDVSTTADSVESRLSRTTTSSTTSLHRDTVHSIVKPPSCWHQVEVFNWALNNRPKSLDPLYITHPLSVIQLAGDCRFQIILERISSPGDRVAGEDTVVEEFHKR